MKTFASKTKNGYKYFKMPNLTTIKNLFKY